MNLAAPIYTETQEKTDSLTFESMDTLFESDNVIQTIDSKRRSALIGFKNTSLPFVKFPLFLPVMAYGRND